MTQGSKIGKAFKIKCGSKYFDTKYGGNPVVIKIEGKDREARLHSSYFPLPG